MVTIAVISDTHIPSRAGSIPEWVGDRVRGSDRVIHAGDFDSTAAYDTVRDLAGGRLTAVRGNMDRLDSLPRVATLTAGGVRFVVTHGTGSPAGYDDRVTATVREKGGDVGVAGHTHKPLDTTHRGVRLLNPGSATGAAPADQTTMMAVTAQDGAIDVQLLTQ